MKKNAFVKVSGDLCRTEETLDLIRQLSADYFVVVCVGAGTQINQAFAERGLPVTKHGPLGRETKTLEERQLARDVLEQNEVAVQDLLAERGIHTVVVTPVLTVGTVLCHVNGDVYVLTVYHGFDRIVVVTTVDRVEKKREHFSQYPKVEVVGVEL